MKVKKVPTEMGRHLAALRNRARRPGKKRADRYNTRRAAIREDRES